METNKETFVKFAESKTGISFYVSNLGNIKRYFNGKQTIVKPILLSGYYYVQIPVKFSWKIKSVHRIVAETFLNNPNAYPQVNHKDENKLNNCVDNLEWCTASYNNSYGSRNERSIKTKKQNKWLQEISQLKNELTDMRELANRLQKKVTYLELENNELNSIVKKLRDKEAIELARLSSKMNKNKNKKYYYKASKEDIWKHHIVYQLRDEKVVKEYRTQSEAMKLGFKVNKFIDTGIADSYGNIWMSYANYNNQTHQD